MAKKTAPVAIRFSARAIDIREGEKVNEKALKDLIRAAGALNLESKSKSKTKRPTSKRAG